MSNAPLTDDELDELREIFAHYDKNKNGVIETKELGALLDALDAHSSPAELKAGMRALDEDGSGVIEFDEFVAWWTDNR